MYKLSTLPGTKSRQILLHVGKSCLLGNKQLMWRGTSLCGTRGTCAPTTHPQFCIMPTKCWVAGHLFTSSPYTPLFNIMKINYLRQNMSWSMEFLQRQFLSREIILRHSWDVSLTTQLIQSSSSKCGNNVLITIHRCFTLSALMFTVCWVDMVTIQEVLLGLPAE